MKAVRDDAAAMVEEERAGEDVASARRSRAVQQTFMVLAIGVYMRIWRGMGSCITVQGRRGASVRRPWSHDVSHLRREKALFCPRAQFFFVRVDKPVFFGVSRLLPTASS